MKLHQFRVAAIANKAARGVFHTDTNAVESWAIWIDRTDAKELALFDADIKEAQARYDARAAESAYYDAIESDAWREHVESERAAYYKRSNLL